MTKHANGHIKLALNLSLEFGNAAFQHITTENIRMTAERCSKSLFSLFIFLDYINHVAGNINPSIHLDFKNLGLTTIPPGLPCTLQSLRLDSNRIARVEDSSFQCLGNLRSLVLDYNALNFISPVAFDPLVSLEYLYLRENPDLTQLPPSFGPNTANILEVYVNGNGILAPSSFMQNMASLTEVGYSFNMLNDFFDGCDHLTTLWHISPSAPNLTDRTPMLNYLWVSDVTDGHIPDENVRGLSRLTEVDIYPLCKNIPAFEGATSLTAIRAPLCEVKSVPNLTHLTALQEFSFSPVVFECDLQCCWMLFKNLSSYTAFVLAQQYCVSRSRQFERAKYFTSQSGADTLFWK